MILKFIGAYILIFMFGVTLHNASVGINYLYEYKPLMEDMENEIKTLRANIRDNACDVPDSKQL